MMQFVLCDKQVFGELQLTPFSKWASLVDYHNNILCRPFFFNYYYLNAGQAPLHDGSHLPRSRLR